jgi:purine-binding chemotaxis protein CheW
MNEQRSFLLFGVGPERYALDVAAVERVVPAAEVTPLPDAPDSVLGLINIAGELMPVIDTRRHFSLPARDMELTDRFIVARASGRPLVLLVDKAEGVVELSGQAVTGMVTGAPGSTSAVATLPDGIVLIQDIEAVAAAGLDGTKGNKKTDSGTR